MMKIGDTGYDVLSDSRSFFGMNTKSYVFALCKLHVTAYLSHIVSKRGRWL